MWPREQHNLPANCNWCHNCHEVDCLDEGFGWSIWSDPIARLECHKAVEYITAADLEQVYPKLDGRSDSDLLDAERGESFPGRPTTLMGREPAVVSDSPRPSRSSFELA